MTDTASGRITTRELLHAVEGAEERITHRIDRMENKADVHQHTTDERLVALETFNAAELARRAGILTVLSGGRAAGLALASATAAIITAVASSGIIG